MSLRKKIIIFFTLVCLCLFVTLGFIIKNRIISLEKNEENLVVNNIKKVHHLLLTSTKYLNGLSFEYSRSEEIISAIKENRTKTFENLEALKNSSMQRLNLSYFILFDKNKEYLYGNSYDLSNDENMSIPYELLAFFKREKLENFFENSQESFMTLSFEKVVFSIKKIENKNQILGYLFLARAFDSKFLNDISEVTQGYISLLSTYSSFDSQNLEYGVNNINYDIKRVSDSELFSYMKFKDVLEDDNFYIRIQEKRLLFQSLLDELWISFSVYGVLFLLLVIFSFLFFYHIFIKRITAIASEIKKASRSESMLVTLKINYNDEISYLTQKMNEMFAAINAHQDKTLKKERDFLQSVLDTQQNIIMITDGKKIQSVNQKFHEIFDSKESFLNNIALLDNRTKANLIAVAKKFNKQERPAPFKVVNGAKYFTFDVSQLDVRKYLICMNDVSNLNKKISHLEVKATIDELTSVYNKSTITQIAQTWIANRSFGLIVFDIDHFKKINDTYGHYIGDCILQDMCKVISNEIPSNDVLGRFGGEEFLVLIDEHTSDNIETIANRLRQLIENYEFVYEGKTVQVTISIGCTFCYQKENFIELFKIADNALYSAKEKGRNRVVYI